MKRKNNILLKGLLVLPLIFLFFDLSSILKAQPATSLEQVVNKDKAGVGYPRTDQSAVKSRIRSVVLYPDRAQVFREGQANVTPETRVLIFPGLPGTIVSGSVRVSARSSVPVKILGVEVQTEYLEAEQLPEVRKIMEEITAVETEISKIKGQETVLDSQEKFLNSFGTALSSQAAKELVGGRPDISGVDKFVDYLGSRLQTIQKERLENAKAMAEKQARLEALKKKKNEIMPARGREEKKVNILVEAAQATQLQIGLNYVVSPARWVPVYTIKALPESSEVELTMAASLFQKTGENWEDVKLILSTSRPTAGYQPGKLDPWYLDFAQARVLLKSMALEEKVSAEVEAEAAAPVMAYEDKAETVETWMGGKL
jgi:uncharacterized protein (TIGR02231 family)